jgi:predicted HicB family RNase H-like nuclease
MGITLEYQGFLGSTDYDENAEVFFGTLVNANVILSFRGASVEELKTSFHDLVDSHLADCEREGIALQLP